jgi:hypothetical protein
VELIGVWSEQPSERVRKTSIVQNFSKETPQLAQPDPSSPSEKWSQRFAKGLPRRASNILPPTQRRAELVKAALTPTIWGASSAVHYG